MFKVGQMVTTFGQSFSQRFLTFSPLLSPENRFYRGDKVRTEWIHRDLVFSQLGSIEVLNTMHYKTFIAFNII